MRWRLQQGRCSSTAQGRSSGRHGPALWARQSCVQISVTTSQRPSCRDLPDLTAAETSPRPRLNAELLLMFTWDATAPIFMPTPSEAFHATRAVMDRQSEPRTRRSHAIITGHQEFMGHGITLRQRGHSAETEHVIETGLERVRVERAPSPSTLVRILDVGTGSGCMRWPWPKKCRARKPRKESSTAALEIARRQADLPTRASVQFHCTDLLQGRAGAFDVWCPIRLMSGSRRMTKVQLEVRKQNRHKAFSTWSTEWK